jgi:hypothetical protein
MLRKSWSIGLVVILFGALLTGAIAQQHQPQGMPQHWTQGTVPHPAQGMGTPQCHIQLDLARKTSLEGFVESVNLERGMGTPSFVIPASGKKVTIIVSPYWALANALFEIRVGDNMSVLAFPSLQYENTYVAAELKNLTTGKVLTLRDDYGMPAGGIGPRHRTGGPGPV